MDRFDELGFEIVPECLNASEILSLIRNLSAAAVHRSRAGIRSALQIESVRTLAHGPRLIQIAAQVLGTTAAPYRATLFDKSLRSNWLVVWHQDTALPLRHRKEVPGWGPWSTKEGVLCAHAPAKALEQILAIRVHLDHSSVDNGPLRVLPGTHILGVLSDESIHELAERIRPQECSVPAGGLLVMRPLLVHASSKALSESPRRVLHIEYAASKRLPDGMELPD